MASEQEYLGNTTSGGGLQDAFFPNELPVFTKKRKTDFEPLRYAPVPTSAELAQAFLESLPGWEGVDRDHRAETPGRMAKMFAQMTERDEFKFTSFPAKNQDMVVLGPIPFYTMCAHHTAPFFGTAHIGYVPEDRIAGLSKFVRTVQYCAKGFWVQEELTHEISGFIEEHLVPKGVAVVLRAEHLCMAMRGVQQPGVITTTSAMTGVFGDHNRTAKAEFMNIIGGK